MMHTIAKIIVASVFASQLLFSQTMPLNLSVSSTPALAYAEVPPLKAITFFQHQTGLPLDIALVMDVSASITARLPAEKEAIDDFLLAVMRPGDSGKLFAFDQTIRATVPITYKGRNLSRRLQKVASDGDTALYDAVHTAAEWLEQDSRLARRVMVLMSDGEENDSRTTFDAAVNSLLNSEAVVYTLNIGDDTTSATGKAGIALLKRLSEATGFSNPQGRGCWFCVSQNSQKIAQPVCHRV
jgi:VWFA-related protein